MWHMRSLTPCCIAAGPKASDSVSDNAGGGPWRHAERFVRTPNIYATFFLMEFFCLDRSNDMGQLKPVPSF